MRVSHSLLSTTAALAIAASMAGAAWAAPDAGGAPGAGQTVEQVVVTGTRLQSGFNAPTPVTVVSSALIEQRAAIDIADLLNELPTFRTSTSPTQSQRLFGGGQNVLDLRGLGTTRTLVLVDGKRTVPTNSTGTFDTNLIPTGLIDRVDIVTGGASAAYGSDAVSGVVNLILKKHIEGIQGAVQYGVSDFGDAKQPLFSLSGGTDFAGGKGAVVAGIEWAEDSGVGTIYTRPWGRLLPGLVGFGTNRGNLPSQGFATGVVYSAQTSGGLIATGPLAGTAFGPGGTPYAFNFGQVYSSLMIGGSNPGGNPFGNWPLATPTNRRTGLVRVDYDFSPAISFFAELEYGRTEGFGFTSFNQATFTIDRSNPFLPASVRQQMVAANLNTVPVGRLLTELGGYRQFDSHDVMQAATGFSGKLGTFDWDIHYSYGRTKDYESVIGNILSANYSAAVSAVTDPSGAIVCGPVATNPNLNATTRAQVTSGCVPINIFGAGSPSQAALDYISRTSYQDTLLERNAAAVSLRGSPFATWAGPVDMALGLEYRRDALNNVADPLGAQQLFSTANRSNYGGSVSVRESFGEIGVPLARDMAFAQALDLNAAVRRTDYSTSGAVTTWKVGITYEPIEDVRLRGTRSRDIRAPNLNELYQSGGAGVSVASAVNPINGKTGALVTAASGNTSLTPEIADTYSVGAVYQPHQSVLEGLRVSADYYDITVNDVIASVAALEIVRRCGAGLQQYCSAITFDNSTFGIALVKTKPYNLNSLATNGLDIEADYRTSLEWLDLPGLLNVRVLGTKVWHLTTTDSVSSIDRAGAAQGGGVPSLSWKVDFTYSQEHLSSTLGFHYTSSVHYDATLIGPDQAGYSPSLSNSINDNLFPSALYIDWSGQIDLLSDGDRKLQLYGGVNNLVNKAPPVTAAIAINSGGDPYDLVGRRYRIGFRFRY